MEAISRSCLPAAAARTKRQRKATCCGVLGAASHRTTCSRSSAAKLTSGLILAMRTCISYWPQYVYLFMIHTTSRGQGLWKPHTPGRLAPSLRQWLSSGCALLHKAIHKPQQAQRNRNRTHNQRHGNQVQQHEGGISRGDRKSVV